MDQSAERLALGGSRHHGASKGRRIFLGDWSVQQGDEMILDCPKVLLDKEILPLKKGFSIGLDVHGQ
jgi:hypothetical protein